MSNMKAGDKGVVIQRTLKDKDGDVIDLSAATLVKLHAIKTGSGGVVLEFTGDLSGDGTDGKVEYVTDEGEFLAGHYQAEFYVEVGTSKLHSDRFHFDVDAVITTP